jgi:GTPase SAR1 family protein
MPYELMNPKYNKTDFLFKLIIIGDSAVGKSCLMQRVTTNEFTEDHEVTVGVEFGTLIIKLEE